MITKTELLNYRHILCTFTPYTFTTYTFTPYTFKPYTFTPYTFTPYTFTPYTFTPYILTPYILYLFCIWLEKKKYSERKSYVVKAHVLLVRSGVRDYSLQGAQAKMALTKFMIDMTF